MEQLGSIFWNEWFWLPNGKTWGDMENKPGSNIYIAQYDDMLWSVPLGLVMLGIRLFFEG